MFEFEHGKTKSIAFLIKGNYLIFNYLKFVCILSTFEKRHFISFFYVCMVNTIYLLSFVETPRKFIIPELSDLHRCYNNILYNIIYNI